MKSSRLFIAGIIAVVYFAVMFWLRPYLGDKNGEYFLKCLTPFGVITAVIFTLYKEYWTEWFYPVKLKIEILPEGETNKDTDWPTVDGRKRQAYCHHLRVTNLTHKTIVNCRVCLKRVALVDESRSRTEEIIFAAPSWMEWAPSESVRDKRTFVKEQILDLGQTWDESEGFTFTIDRDQQSAINRMKGKFKPGATVKCFLYATADNYHEEQVFGFKIIVGDTFHGNLINPSIVTPLD